MKTKFTFLVLLGYGVVRFAGSSDRVFQDGDMRCCSGVSEVDL